MPLKDCNKRCDQCAYNLGSDANTEPWNRLTAILAKLGPFPFYCHDTVPWRDSDHCYSRKEFKAARPGLCKGWIEEVQELSTTGYYKNRSMMLKVLAQVCLENYQWWTTTKDLKDKAEAFKAFKRTFKKLVNREKQFMQRPKRNIQSPL